MKSIKVQPGETFEVIITDDKGTDIFKQCYAFDPDSKISWNRGNGVTEVEMDIIPIN